MTEPVFLRPPPAGSRAGPPARGWRLALALACAAALAGCAGQRSDQSSGLLSPYRIDLPQGNYLTAEMLDQVKPGMTREQVRQVLGAPLLNPLFRPDRWDYVFRYQYPNGRAELRRVALIFKDDQITTIRADTLPASEAVIDPALPGYKPPAGERR